MEEEIVLKGLGWRGACVITEASPLGVKPKAEDDMDCVEAAGALSSGVSPVWGLRLGPHLYP